MGGGAQPVLWLKHNKSKLYEKYAEESKRNGRRTISRTMFYQGLEAGLCNICREYGAENFENLLKCADRLQTEWKKTMGNISKPISVCFTHNLKPVVDILINLFNATTAKTVQGLLSQSVNALAYTLFIQNVNYYELGI